jgi:predicted nucleotidyltransferase
MDESLLKSMTETIVEELHPEEVILFGSHAKGTERAGSDVDFLVVLPNSEETRRQRRRLTGRVYRRLAAFPVPKDILVYTRDEVERWRGVAGHVVATCLREGRQLYARP